MCVCVYVCTREGLRFISPLLSFPSSLVFLHLQMRLFAWLRRRNGTEMEEEVHGSEKEQVREKKFRDSECEWRGRRNACRQKKTKNHIVPGRYHHFQDGCRWRRPLWDQANQARDPLLFATKWATRCDTFLTLRRRSSA